ncbi:alpha/beta-hydrolase [Pseudovirgaria hyperparasitica]|uniref:Carboxylic ester hydrolase n=1 Tax=Pseudovirgaria hyperparasitica TaxID=470096 RepID=A0A6A6W6Z2_9PEZI|nr:alpha/beta-hydrolase [Pseudovirgaria hyperparasitica]KAF2757337.1 alpha/beta-hydrolase [Pseudovirgaria hyperparasitica]
MMFINLFLLLWTAFVSASSLAYQQTPGALQQVTDFGYNPTNIGFYIYVPNALVSNPAIVVAVHYCTGSAQAYYDNSPYKTLAEQYGFIVIYPESPWSGACWDVSSKATLTHNGGGDSNAIVNMVSWTVSKYRADTSRVFVTGLSSGAMMTNVLSATYPDVFKAATLYAGVPAGCFVSDTNQQAAWNTSCAEGQVVHTPAVWADIVRDMYPGYSGPYPRIQIYHGGADTGLYPQNYYETCKQWSGVWGYDYSKPQSTQVDSPASGWTRTVFGPGVQGIFNPEVNHSISIFGDEDMKWFGFTGVSLW